MLRPGLTSRIERLAGAKVESYRRVEGGYTPALRLVCGTSKGSFFAKVATTPVTREALSREIRVYNSLSGDFMPRLLASEDDESEPILLIEDLSARHWPPPWDARHVELALAQVDAMHDTRPPLETYAQAHGALGESWRAVAADPSPFLSLGFADGAWLEASLPALARYEESCPTAGDRLTHWDLRSDNVCVAEGRAIFIDWNGACLSNPRLDLGFWLPSLAYEAGIEPETILPDAPEVAARVSGFFAARAGLPRISDAPRVRHVQRRQLATALPWAVRALDLPPLTNAGPVEIS
ncbi:MAG TPA: aminoglycoside phosphotransferase family protein [Pyrinomonadaceae bacterium]|nr:aminoglycoside phosphotransferase family protein [Pyrinomonadaceae bacterium]